ncbi:hypothetical protein [uncultured Microbulbifer sp.]|uniref:hypothetical protein n=1 Tax=uncultured Microbulbifer sp. TaxID=348147 RepID=UPI0026216A49|nr:hypothetical protein [uncultured Microbulbifer sp.]
MEIFNKVLGHELFAFPRHAPRLNFLETDRQIKAACAAFIAHNRLLKFEEFRRLAPKYGFFGKIDEA